MYAFGFGFCFQWVCSLLHAHFSFQLKTFFFKSTENRPHTQTHTNTVLNGFIWRLSTWLIKSLHHTQYGWEIYCWKIVAKVNDQHLFLRFKSQAGSIFRSFSFFYTNKWNTRTHASAKVSFQKLHELVILMGSAQPKKRVHFGRKVEDLEFFIFIVLNFPAKGSAKVFENPFDKHNGLLPRKKCGYGFATENVTFIFEQKVCKLCQQFPSYFTRRKNVIPNLHVMKRSMCTFSSRIQNMTYDMNMK